MSKPLSPIYSCKRNSHGGDPPSFLFLHLLRILLLQLKTDLLLDSAIAFSSSKLLPYVNFTRSYDVVGLTFLDPLVMPANSIDLLPRS